jgi:hypothetical protein
LGAESSPCERKKNACGGPCPPQRGQGQRSALSLPEPPRTLQTRSIKGYTPQPTEFTASFETRRQEQKRLRLSLSRLPLPARGHCSSLPAAAAHHCSAQIRKSLPPQQQAPRRGPMRNDNRHSNKHTWRNTTKCNVRSKFR